MNKNVCKRWIKYAVECIINAPHPVTQERLKTQDTIAATLTFDLLSFDLKN